MSFFLKKKIRQNSTIPDNKTNLDVSVLERFICKRIFNLCTDAPVYQVKVGDREDAQASSFESRVGRWRINPGPQIAGIVPLDIIPMVALRICKPDTETPPT